MSIRCRAAVLGSPVAHSLSPILHRAAHLALGLAGWRYDAVECDEASFPGLVAQLGPEWVGLSLTMPLKRIGLSIADEASSLARDVGAANTLLLGDDGNRAENTDVAGIAGALREAGVTAVERSLVLGAGGTAQAALAALRELGDPSPVVMVRDPGRTLDLRAAAERLGVRPRIVGGLLDDPLPEARIVVCTLPPGAADTLRISGAGEGGVILDVVYSPWPTALASSAGRRGWRTVSGLSMLLHQAAQQVLLMTGREAPMAAMRAALAQAVSAREGKAALEI